MFPSEFSFGPFQQGACVPERGGYRWTGEGRLGGPGSRQRLPLAHQGLRRHLPHAA